MSNVILTGANSYLGTAIERALAEAGHHVMSVVSPRARPGAQSDDRVVADLTLPLPTKVADRLAAADHVLHLAWQRGSDVNDVVATNLRMLKTLMAVVPAAKISFFSSVAASGTTKSVYGASKFRVQDQARHAGCAALVCGLVIDDPPRSAYALVHRMATQLPLRIRIAGSCPVYPITIGDLARTMTAFVAAPRSAATYGLFLPGGIPINEFLAVLEAQHPRPRLPVRVPLRAILAAGRVLRATPAKGLGEKLLTFFTKDESALARVVPCPALEIAETRRMLIASAT